MLFKNQIPLIAVLFCSLSLNAQKNKISKSPVPLWVNRTSSNLNQNSLDGDASDGYIDISYEKQVNVKEQATYYKSALKILSEAGAENRSDVSVDFDPTYQSLSFHTISIIRDERIISKLDLSKIKVIQQEKDLTKHLYNGTFSAYQILDDVRKGDIIEYSYTIKGFNPVFNKFATIFETNFAVPVYNLYYKVILPVERNVDIKTIGSNVVPVIQRTSSEISYEWTLKNVPAVHVASNIPEWYDPYSSIDISEYKNWNEVSQWASKLFPFNIQLSAELHKKIQTLKELEISEEEKAVKALQFVQDEIRYMGVEVGERSHMPNSPNKVLAQRYGDCKDKSYLLCTILRGIGMDATPVLINTSYKKTIKSWLPSPHSFNHTTVLLNLNGKQYWLDPTISYQRGKLENISYPDYQIGLTVDNAQDLTFIPSQEKGKSEIREVFQVPDYYGRAQLKVITQNTGHFADDSRYDFKTNSLYDIKKRFLEYYKSSFDNVIADSVTYKDDETTGIFTISEYYSINNFWKLKDGRSRRSLEPFVIDGVLKKIQSSDHKMPFNLIYPAKYHEIVEVNLPDDWPVEQSSSTIRCTAFDFDYNYSYSGNKVTLEYNYQSLKDHIDPTETEDYSAKYKQVDENCGFEISFGDAARETRLSKNDPEKGNRGAHNLYNILYSLLAVTAVTTFIIRRSNRTGY